MTVRTILILTAGLLVIASTASFAQSQRPVPRPLEISTQEQQKPTSNDQHPTSTHATSDNPAIQIDRNVDAKETKASTDDYRTKHDDKASADWYIMIATCVLAACAIVQFIAMVLQYLAMRKQAASLQETVQAAKDASEDTQRSIAQAQRSADAMQEVANTMIRSTETTREISARQENFGKMQLRAYLTVHAGQSAIQNREAGVRYGIQMVVRNAGHTPAHEVRFAIKLSVMSSPLPIDADLSIGQNPESVVGHVPFGEQFLITALLDEFLEDDTVQDISERGGKKLYVYGTVWYKDAFGESHHTNFCQSVWWDKETKLFTNFVSHHNDAT